MTAEAYKAYKAHKKDAKGEIGATVSKRFGYADVVSALPGSPAEKAGIESTDIFESIEGQSTRDMSLAEIRNVLSRQPGSNVTVSVVSARRAEPQKVVITRDVVSIPPVAEKMIEDGIGYIKVDDLPDGSALILSVAKYYSPSGKAIQDASVTPTLVVADAEDSVGPEDDEQETTPQPEAKPKNTQDDQLKKAVEVLQSHNG